MSRSPEFDPSMKNSSPEAGEVPVHPRFNIDEINIFPSPKTYPEYIEQLRRMDQESDTKDEPDIESMIERGRERLFKTIEAEEKKRNNPWEPFNLEPQSNQRFINLYNGPYSEHMEFNREKSERLLEVAGIEGKVVIVDVPRDRSAGGATITSVNPDGSSSAGRFKSAEKQKTVKSALEGWKIEIPGEDILDEIVRKDSKKPLNERFAVKVNRTVRDSVREIVFREKLTPDGPHEFFL
jgi:hypothetical protein